MPVIEISSLSHPGVEVFSTLTETQLRNRTEPGKGIFIVESPKVITRALDSGYEPLAILCEYKHIVGDAAEIIERCENVPVYTGSRELLATLTGYVLTRGVLCAMRRPEPRSMEEVCRDARRIVVIDRVSMGAVFFVPWAWMNGSLSDLGKLGFRTAAMALTDDSIPIDNPALVNESKLAIVMGNEGEGLSHETITEADYVVRIPMVHGVDSLNVAAAAAVAFWQLRVPQS